MKKENKLIFDNFSTSTRYDIRQAIKNNNKIEFFNYKNNSEINFFIINVKSFYKNKKISNTLVKKYFNNNKHFYIVKISSESIWHTSALYVFDDKRFRLVILINNYLNVEKKIIGFSSKLLIWKSIEFSKTLGCHIFDLGGLDNTKKDHLKGINQFKLSFGGSQTYEYNSLITNNFLFRLFYKFLYLFRKSND